MAEKPNPFSEAQLRRLLRTPDAQLVRSWPAHTRADLRRWKREAEQKLDPERQIQVDLDLRRAREENQELRSRYKAMQEAYQQLKRDSDLYDLLESSPSSVPVQVKTKNQKREATPILALSDWHVETLIKRGDSQGYNYMDLAVADARINQCFSSFGKLVELDRHGSLIRNCVVWLGGDFIGGNIHDDIIERAQLGPAEAAVWAGDRIRGGLEHILNLGFDLITVVCSTDNHGRITKKPRAATATGSSLNTLMYWGLANWFRDTPEIQFVMPDSPLTYLSIYDKVFRMHHGDMVKYNDGVHGLAVPVIKRIRAWDQLVQAYHTIIGHYHTYTNGSNFTTNGSVCGYDGFAQGHGFAPEPPQQAYLLMDSLRGITRRGPVFCEGAK